MYGLVNRLPVEASVPPAFVLFALPSLVAASQVAQVAEVYRMAAERTCQQLMPPRPLGVPAFSRN